MLIDTKTWKKLEAAAKRIVKDPIIDKTESIRQLDVVLRHIQDVRNGRSLVLRYIGHSLRDAFHAIRDIGPGYRLSDIVPMLRDGREFSIPMPSDGRTNDAVIDELRKAGLMVTID